MRSKRSDRPLFRGSAALLLIACLMPVSAGANPCVGGASSDVSDFLNEYGFPVAGVLILYLLYFIPGVYAEWRIVGDAFHLPEPTWSQLRKAFVALNIATFAVLDGSIVAAFATIGMDGFAGSVRGWALILIGEAMVILAEGRFLDWWADRNANAEERPSGGMMRLAARANLVSFAIGSLFTGMIHLVFVRDFP